MTGALDNITRLYMEFFSNLGMVEIGKFTVYVPPPPPPPEPTLPIPSASASASADYKGQPSISVRGLTLRSAFQLCGIHRPDIIKMDIEGAEYGVLHRALDEGTLDGVSQLMVEFHHFLPGLQPSQTRQIIARLSAAGFRIGWVGRTNHEYLFVRP